MADFGPPQPTPNGLANLSVEGWEAVAWVVSKEALGRPCNEVRDEIKRRFGHRVHDEITKLVRNDNKVVHLKPPTTPQQKELL